VTSPVLASTFHMYPLGRAAITSLSAKVKHKCSKNYLISKKILIFCLLYPGGKKVTPKNPYFSFVPNRIASFVVMSSV